MSMWGVREHVRNLSGLELTALSCSLKVENGEEKGLNMRRSHLLSVYHVQVTMRFTGTDSISSDKSYKVGLLSSTFSGRGN